MEIGVQMDRRRRRWVRRGKVGIDVDLERQRKS